MTNLLAIININVKTKTTSVNWNRQWINSQLKLLIRLKQKLCRKMRTFKTKASQRQYIEIKKTKQKKKKNTQIMAKFLGTLTATKNNLSISKFQSNHTAELKKIS